MCGLEQFQKVQEPNLHNTNRETQFQCNNSTYNVSIPISTQIGEFELDSFREI